MADTIGALISELDAFCKTAEERESENITGTSPSSLPGAENDKKIPTGATKADPKVSDPQINSSGNRTLTGAKNGGDFPASNANTYKADEPVLTPDTKALDSTDANAKEAAYKGNNIVDFILGKKASSKKSASYNHAAEPITVDMALMAKIAAITLADEEGQFAVQQALTKRAGAEFAEEVLDTLEKRAEEEELNYAWIKGAEDAEQMIGNIQEAQGAADAEEALGNAAEAQGVADAEEAMGDVEDAECDENAECDQDDEDDGELDDYSPDEIIEAVQELADEGTIPPEQAQEVISAVSGAAQEDGNPGEVSEEDLAEAIVEAVESGELSEEDAQALVEAIAEESDVSDTTDEALADSVAEAQGAADAEEAIGDVAEAQGAADAEAALADAAQKQASANRELFKRQLINILSRG
jgi:hypothetical protein